MSTEAARKSHHHGRLRDSVIEFAMAEARRGEIESISMRDLSRQIGVSPAAVYRHFPDREAILRAVARAGFDLLADRFEAALPFASVAQDAEAALERFQALSVAYVMFARDHYGLWRLMFGPYGRDPDAPKLARPSTYDWLGKALAELLTFGVIGAANDSDKYFVWTSIHGFSDLQTSSVGPDSSLPVSARRQALTALKCLGFRGSPDPGPIP